MSFGTHNVDRVTAFLALDNCSFLSNQILLDSAKNWGTGDSTTRCLWAQLRRVNCLHPEVGSYPFSLHILLEEHQLVDSLHWWRHKSALSLWTKRFWILPKIEDQETIRLAASGHNFTGSVVRTLLYNLPVVAANSMGVVSVGIFPTFVAS